MKKSNVLRAAAVAMVAALSIGAAYAAFSAITDTKENTFSIVAGKKDEEPKGSIEEPVWDSEIDEHEDLQPGEKVNKDPHLNNTTEYEANGYVVVYVPTVEAKTTDEPTTAKTHDTVKLGATGTDWSLVASHVSETAGKDSVYIFKYGKTIASGTQTTDPVFSEFTVEDFTELTSNFEGQIDVKGYLFQSVNFDDSAALDSVKNDIADDYGETITNWQ